MGFGAFLITTIISALFTENIVFYQTIGICPFLGVSKRTNTALGMGLAVTLVITISSMLAYLLYTFILLPLYLEYLQILVVILVIASLVQLLEFVLKKFSSALYKNLGVYLPLITTNCAVLGTALGVITLGLNFAETIVFSIFTGLGFLLALYIMSCLRERIDNNLNIPKSFQGLPITLIASGLIAMAFMGLSGLNFFA